MLSDKSIKQLLKENKISLLDRWAISIAVLTWVEKKIHIQKAPLLFFTDIFEFDLANKKVLFPDENILIFKSDVPYEYLSPEETGRIQNAPDYRTNFYRLGIIWYELLTGEPPFYNEDPYKIVWQHLAQAPPVIRNNEIPSSAKAIVDKLLSKKADERYQSIEGLKRDWDIAYEDFLTQKYTNDNFIPGKYDFDEVFHLPDEMRKWDEELSIIENLYKRVSQNEKKGLLYVYGGNNVGKRNLLHLTYRKYISRGYPVFLGTCSQLENIPFEPIINAFNEYATHLLNFETQKNVEKVKENLLNQLEEKISIFTTFAPYWKEILNIESSAPVEIGFESQNRLAFVIAKVLSILSTPENPIIFILEDIQHISIQTLRLFNLLIAEPELKYFVAIVSSNEYDRVLNENHSQNKLLNTQTSGIIEKIIINPLTNFQIEELLINEKFDLINANKLANIISVKTKGIPPFIRNLIRQATENNLIKLNDTKSGWIADFNGIEKISISQNNSEKEEDKFLSLDSTTKEWLEVAACIGFQFDIESCNSITNTTDEIQLKQTIEKLLFIELLFPDIIHNHLFKFSNHLFHNFVLNQIESKRKKKIYRSILDYQIKHNVSFLDDKNLYILIGYILELDAEELFEFKHILIEGAERSKRIGAFENAAKYYKSLISGNAFSDEMEKFELYAQLLEMLAGNLEFDEYNKKLNEIYENISITDVFQSRLDLIECKTLILQQKLPEAVIYAKKSLLREGIKINLTPSLPQIIFSMIKAQNSMKGYTISELKNLPLTKDPKTKYILELLQETSSAFFLAAPKALPQVLALQINIAIKKGISETMGLVFAAYGFNISAFSGQFEKAEEMMTLASTLDLRFGNIKGAVVVRFLHAALTRHWHFPIKENAALLRENYYAGRESGLIQMAYFSLATGDIFEVISGKPIHILFSQFESDYKSCIDKQQDSMAIFLTMALEYCSELSEKSKSPHILEGKYFSQQSQKNKFIEENLQTNLAILFYFESSLHLIWVMTKVAKERLKIIDSLSAEVGLSSLSLLFASIQFTILAYKDSGPINSLMRSNRKKIAKWAKQSSINFSGWYNYLEAIICIRNNNFENAFYHLEYAIENAEENGMLNLKALALEEKGNLLILKSSKKKISLALIQAYNCYQSWGAKAKCNELEKLYPNIRHISMLDKEFNDNRDITSLLRANSSIAGEIRLENMLENLLTILIENAGAQMAVILISEQTWFKEVARKFGNTQVTFNNKIINKETIPNSVIQYVQKFQKPIILNNPLQDPRWNLDQYFVKFNPVSILCIPILKNREIKAIVYMENNLTQGAFTSEAVELITILSGQIAISIVIERLETELINEVNKAKHEIQQFTLNNISQELHDNVGQLLSLTKMQLNQLELTEGANKEIIREAGLNVSKVMTELRDLAKGMSSERISLLGLYDSVFEEVERINKSKVIEVKLNSEGVKRELDSRKQLVIFRVIQESFQNILKHAHATSVHINFYYEPQQIIIKIKDNGKGFEFDSLHPQESGLGLMNIFNRIKMIGGEIKLNTAPNNGTEIQIFISEHQIEK